MHWTKLFASNSAGKLSRDGVPGLLYEAGYMYRVSKGPVVYLPLGQRSILKITKLLREKLDAEGWQELLLPIFAEHRDVIPLKDEVFPPSGSVNAAAWEMQRIDVQEIAMIASGNLQSYKQFPQLWFVLESAQLSPTLTKQLSGNLYVLDFDENRFNEKSRTMDRILGELFDICHIQYQLVEQNGPRCSDEHSRVWLSDADRSSQSDADPVAYCIRLNPASSKIWNLFVTNREGDLSPVHLCACYVNIELILAACAEQNRDQSGLLLPPSIAPFQVVITPCKVSDSSQMSAAEQLANKLADSGLDVLLDDRSDLTDSRFAASMSAGCPFQIIVDDEFKNGTISVNDRYAMQRKPFRIDDSIRFLTQKCLAR